MADELTVERGKPKRQVAKGLHRFVPIVGIWSSEGQKTLYKGPPEPNASASEMTTPPFGLSLAGERFQDGHVQASITLSKTRQSSAGLVVGYSSLREPYYIAQIGAYDRGFSISSYQPNIGWRALDVGSDISNLVPGQRYELRLALSGQRMILSIDGVQVTSVVAHEPIKGHGFGLFAWGPNKVTFEDILLEGTKPKAFIVMPFAPEFQALYKDVIEPLTDKAGFEVIRVDEIFNAGLILDDIRQQIQESQIVVAEVSTPNPNVFYELGYAHAVGKPTILMARRSSEASLPFDIRGYRVVFYDDTIAGKRGVEELLSKHLDAIKR